MRRQPNVGFGNIEEVWSIIENDMCKVVLIRQRNSVVTSKYIYKINLFAGIQSCLKLSQNLVFYDKSKHIERKYNYVRDMV